jgi:predicted RecB family nuclease
MRRGVDVVYQGTFFDGAWGAQADFLLRVETPSLFGDWSYEIADTKRARKLKVAALLQMATYAEPLTVLQGPTTCTCSIRGGTPRWRRSRSTARTGWGRARR